jgi:hypothetical protein
MPAGAADPASAKETVTTRDGWTMAQNSHLMGDMQITASAKGIIAISVKKGLSLLCVAPFKEVVLFSDRSKKYHTTPFEKFRCPVENTMTVFNNGLLSDIPMLAAGDKTENGLKVHVLKSTEQFKQRQLARFRIREVPGRAAANLACNATEDFKLDPHIADVLVRFYALPKLPGFPVSAVVVDLGSDRVNYLVTIKSRKSKVSDAIFCVPPTYQKVAHFQDVYVNQNTADEIDLMNLGH